MASRNRYVFALVFACIAVLFYVKGDSEVSYQVENKTQRELIKPKTIYDYQTRIAAYKDLIQSRCLLEFLKNGESLISQNFQQLRLDSLPKHFFMTKSQLTKRQIWVMGGQRIVDFCRGFPTYLIQDFNPENVQEYDFNAVLNHYDTVLKRNKRNTRQYFSGKIQGQTQSQYLSYGNDNTNGNGKAEAESSITGSRAIVSSNRNGMGQAQSQTNSVNGCEECFDPGNRKYTEQTYVSPSNDPSKLYNSRVNPSTSIDKNEYDSHDPNLSSARPIIHRGRSQQPSGNAAHINQNHQTFRQTPSTQNIPHPETVDTSRYRYNGQHPTPHIGSQGRTQQFQHEEDYPLGSERTQTIDKNMQNGNRGSNTFSDFDNVDEDVDERGQQRATGPHYQGEVERPTKYSNNYNTRSQNPLSNVQVPNYDRYEQTSNSQKPYAGRNQGNDADHVSHQGKFQDPNRYDDDLNFRRQYVPSKQRLHGQDVALEPGLQTSNVNDKFHPAYPNKADHKIMSGTPVIKNQNYFTGKITPQKSSSEHHSSRNNVYRPNRLLPGTDSDTNVPNTPTNINNNEDSITQHDLMPQFNSNNNAKQTVITNKQISSNLRNTNKGNFQDLKGTSLEYDSVFTPNSGNVNSADQLKVDGNNDYIGEPSMYGKNDEQFEDSRNRPQFINNNQRKTFYNKNPTNDNMSGGLPRQNQSPRVMSHQVNALQNKYGDDSEENQSWNRAKNVNPSLNKGYGQRVSTYNNSQHSPVSGIPTLNGNKKSSQTDSQDEDFNNNYEQPHLPNSNLNQLLQGNHRTLEGQRNTNLPPTQQNRLSQAQSSVLQQKHKTQASSAATQTRDDTPQSFSQVSGSSSGRASFSASAASINGPDGTQSEVMANNMGVSSSAHGHGDVSQSQAQVHLSYNDGIQSSAQSSGYRRTQSQLQFDKRLGMASAQANGVGRTAAQAELGFQPRNQIRQDEMMRGGMASSQSGYNHGSSQVQAGSTLHLGVNYQGGAQALSDQHKGANSRQFQKGYKALLPQDEPYVEDDDDLEHMNYGQLDDGEDMENIMNQRMKYQDQQIVLNPVSNYDAVVRRSVGNRKSPIFESGATIPGANGFIVPRGFKGRLISISNDQGVYTSGEESQAQSVQLIPRQ